MRLWIGWAIINRLTGEKSVNMLSWGRFHSRRSNTTRGQIDFGSDEHFKMTTKWPAILVVISQSFFISKCHHTFWREMHLTSKMTDPKNRFHSHLKFPGEMNLTDKMNLTDDYETSLWIRQASPQWARARSVRVVSWLNHETVKNLNGDNSSEVTDRVSYKSANAIARNRFELPAEMRIGQKTLADKRGPQNLSWRKNHSPF